MGNPAKPKLTTADAPLHMPLPSRDRVDLFLKRVPDGGKVLDFGCGVGRWAQVMHAMRKDLSIDMLDRKMDSLAPKYLSARPWRGKLLQCEFETFKAKDSYDGIWARSSLFGMNRASLGKVLDEFAAALKPGAVLAFNYVRDDEDTRDLGLYGLETPQLTEMLEKRGLMLEHVLEEGEMPYGEDGHRIKSTAYYACKPPC